MMSRGKGGLRLNLQLRSYPCLRMFARHARLERARDMVLGDPTCEPVLPDRLRADNSCLRTYVITLPALM